MPSIKAQPLFFDSSARIGSFFGNTIMKGADNSEIIAMAWADEVPFDAIQNQYGLSEGEVIRLMRQRLKPRSFRLWRHRVTGRLAKHTQRTNCLARRRALNKRDRWSPEE